MSSDAPILPEDPAVLKAMIAALQAENAKMSELPPENRTVTEATI